MTLDAFRRLLDTRRRIKAIQATRRAPVIASQLAAMRLAR